MSKINYVINKEKRTIVAIMTDCEYDILDSLIKAGLYSLYDYGDKVKKAMIPNVFRGKAKCSPEDEWDEEAGKKIARERMLAKYYLHKAKKFKQILADFLEATDVLTFFARNSIEKCEMYLKK